MKKGHWLLTIALALLVAVPAFAQTPSLGIYFDLAGTQAYQPGHIGLNEAHTAYVIARAEMLIGGAAYKITIDDPNLMFTGASYPAGIQIGDALNGVEVGFTEPVVGYFGVPVRVSTLSLFAPSYWGEPATICVVPFPGKYNDVVLADGQGVLFPASGLCGQLTSTVATDADSWSHVKGLYR